MRFHAAVIVTGATAVAANSATLLLPGFQGHDLQASVVASAGDATTYLVTCPTTVVASACGIPDSGLTAIAAPTSVVLQDVSDGTTAVVSCNVEGTTSASCHASQGTIDVTHTLASSDMNWMAVTITSSVSTTTTPTPTPTHTPTHSLVTSTLTPSSTSTPIPSSTFTPAFSPKKLAASSTPLKIVSASATLSPVVADSATAAAAVVSSASASVTPVSANGAVSLTGSAWAFGAAAVALAYALV